MHRTGLFFALISVQLPLAVGLLLLGVIASRLGLSTAVPALRWMFVLVFGALVSVPPGRTPRPRMWRSGGVVLNWRIAWRALGLSVVPALVWGSAAIGGGWLFISNNRLEGSVASAAARFAGAMACVFCLVTLAKGLAVRRPSWPLARSFPWSAIRRIIEDALFLGIHTLPLVLLVGLRYPASGILILSVVPFMSVRAAEYIRRIPELRVAALTLFGEASIVAVALTLLPGTAILWMLATIWALFSARQSEYRQKSTGWFELHHESAGDTSSWSES